MNIQPVKTAIVGCGVISDAYLNTMIEKFAILDVVGCCDRNAEKAKTRAQKYGIKVLTLDEILADDSIEIVVNLTAPLAHYPVIKQLLEGGKHVYTEKVLAVELDHAADLVATAAQKNLYLGAAPDTFLGAAIQTARYVVDSGMIGEITSCFCALTRDSDILSRAAPFTTKPGGGIGFDVGIYYITALLSILGPVKEVSGLCKPGNRNEQIIRWNISASRFRSNAKISWRRLSNLSAERSGICYSTPIPSLFCRKSPAWSYSEPWASCIWPIRIISGGVRVILKGNSEPFTMPQSHAFSTECRGLGVAEMAWSLRRGRKHRASKELAYHALDVLHSIVKSSETKANQVVKSSFEKMPPLPRGYSGQTVFEFIEETGIAL